MRALWIIALIPLITGCGGIGNANTRAFVATPVPDEIRIVIYSTQTNQGRSTWRLTNDDLRVRLTTNAPNGKVLASRARKMTPNDYNWVVYNLDKVNFLKAKSIPTSRPASRNETLTIITQSDKYTYQQNARSKFPAGFQKIVNIIPGLINAR